VRTWRASCAGQASARFWKISAVIEATKDEADQAVEAIGRALCPEPDHAGYCEVPWVTMTCRFDDLDDDERASWQAEFDEDRRKADAADSASS
jgi:hypothetical protein